MEINVVCDIKCLLGEGPFWDDRTNRVFWVDIMNSRFHAYNPQTGKHQTFEVGQFVGCIVPCDEPDTVYTALGSGFASFSMNNSQLKAISDPETNLINNRFNDGKCDVMGRLWAGTMSMIDEPGKGSLYTLEKDFSVKKKIAGVSISNGLAWSMDNQIMYYIDSPTFTIVAFDFDPDTGDLSNQRVVVNIPKDSGDPDGMTIDNEGKLWVAHWEGSQVCCWDPDSGQKITSIALPVSKPTSCAFGGENLDRLFVTSARVDLDDDQLAEEPLAGSLFVVDGLGAKGGKVSRFGVRNY